MASTHRVSDPTDLRAEWIKIDRGFSVRPWPCSLRPQMRYVLFDLSNAFFQFSLGSIIIKTIVSTSLPTIARELGATQNQYTWVGVAYMLTQTACQPLYGRISDLVGRKVRLKYPIKRRQFLYFPFMSEPTIFKYDDLCYWITSMRSSQGLVTHYHYDVTSILTDSLLPSHRLSLGLLLLVASPVLAGVVLSAQFGL